MSCDRIDSLLSDGAPLDAGAKEHIAGCASCRSMITVLGESGEELGSEEVGRLKTLVSKDLRPVRPLPSDRKLVALLLIFFVSFSVLAAWPTRYHGLRGLNATQMAIYFSVIACCAFLGALAIIQEMIPGSRKRISPVLAMALAVIGLIAVIVVLFPNFSTNHFVRYGEGCIRVGSVCGLLAGLLLFLALRTGFFASPVSAAISVGFFAGLSGVAVLAMHCSLLTVPHILVWHFGVLLLGLAAGTGIGLLLEIAGSKKIFANRNFRDSAPE